MLIVNPAVPMGWASHGAMASPWMSRAITRDCSEISTWCFLSGLPGPVGLVLANVHGFSSRFEWPGVDERSPSSLGSAGPGWCFHGAACVSVHCRLGLMPYRTYGGHTDGSRGLFIACLGVVWVIVIIERCCRCRPLPPSIECHWSWASRGTS